MNDKNKGRFHDRTKYGPLEKAFADLWEKENEMDSNINYGNGVLQGLFSERARWQIIHRHEVSDDERMIAATVVQWLGTNCGRAFMEEALGKCGLKITEL